MSTYATWARPHEALLNDLQSDIKKISAEFHTPYLQCHLDIAPGIEMPLEKLKERLTTVVKNHKPFEVEITAIDYSTKEHWTYFYFLVKPTQELVKLRRETTKALGKDLEAYFAHMSIMYGDENLDTQKEEIIKQIESKYIGKTFTVHKLVVFQITETPSEWPQVAEISLK